MLRNVQASDFGIYKLTAQRASFDLKFEYNVTVEQDHQFDKITTIVAIVIGVLCFVIVILILLCCNKLYAQVLWKRYFGKFHPGGLMHLFSYHEKAIVALSFGQNILTRFGADHFPSFSVDV